MLNKIRVDGKGSVSFFFFKQKTAYEMRISDWSSDVCSSDLRTVEFPRLSRDHAGRGAPGRRLPDTGRSDTGWGRGDRRACDCPRADRIDLCADRKAHSLVARQQTFCLKSIGSARFQHTSEEGRVGKGGGRTGKFRGMAK